MRGGADCVMSEVREYLYGCKGEVGNHHFGTKLESGAAECSKYYPLFLHFVVVFLSTKLISP